MRVWFISRRCQYLKDELENVWKKATMLWTERSGVRVPAITRGFPLLQIVQTGSGGHPVFCSKGIGVLCSGGKAPGA